MTHIVPGWYPDPIVPSTQLRWWDGEKWTEHSYPLTTEATSPEDPAAAPSEADGNDIPEHRVDVIDPVAAPTPFDYPAPVPTGPTPYPMPGNAPGAYPPGAYAPYGPLSSRYVTHDGQPLAGWGARFLARILDGILTGIVSGILAFPFVREIWTTSIREMRQEMERTGTGTMTWGMASPELVGEYVAYTAIALLVALVYQASFLKWLQATPGKLVMGIKVRKVAADGPLDWGTILRRFGAQDGVSALGIVPFVGSLAGIYGIIDGLFPLWDSRRQSIHDKAADTQVVYTSR